MAYAKNITLLLALAPQPAPAADVALVGMIGSMAIVVIDGAQPRTLAPGKKTPEGVLLLGTQKDSATFEIDGRKQVLHMGQVYMKRTSAKQSVTLNADARGHFIALGSINGGSVRFIVDTGATFVSLSASDAERLGIDYRKGTPSRMQTANGIAAAYRVKLDRVTLGDISLDNVDAVVSETETSGMALLGMSFLNRMEMQREGQTMTLTKRY